MPINYSLIEFVLFRKLKSAALAVYHNADKIPEERLQVLQNEILKHYPPETEITNELLKEAMNTVTR